MILKAFVLLFLLTLPLTFFPLVSGVFGGILFSFWTSSRIIEHTNSLLFEIDQYGWMDSFSVPGALSMQEFMDAKSAFHIPKLSTHDWAPKLGFTLPKEYVDFGSEASHSSQIDKLASLDGLMRDTRCYSSKPAEQWVFISSLAWPTIYEWDEAFDTIIRESYASPLNDTGFAFVECASSGFLCGVWGVRFPTLLHFQVGGQSPEEDEMDPDLSYEAELEDLRPVTVRIIELPLEGSYTGLSSNVFPSPYEQLRAIIRVPRLYEQFDTYNPTDQLMKRFNEHLDELEWRYRAIHNYYEADKWVIRHMTEPLGVEPYLPYLMNGIFELTWGLTELVRWPIRLVWDAVRGFLGYPDQWMYGEVREHGNVWDGMMAAFWDSFNSRFDAPTAGSAFVQNATNAPSPAPT